MEHLLSESYMPHGHCYFWEPGLVWLHLLSDVGVFAAYSAIPAFLAILLRRRGDIEFRGVVWLFVAFIVLCGFTHLMGAVTIWHPYYQFEGALKMVTALVSIATAVTLFRAMPVALAIPSPAALRAEVAQRTKSEERLRDQLARTEAILASLPDAVLELDEAGEIVSVAGSAKSLVAQKELEGGAFESWEQEVLEALRPELVRSPDREGALATSFRLRSPFGVELDYKARSVPLEAGGWVVSIQDVSDQVRLVESLRTSRQVLEQFVYTASHDLRSPLRAVSQLASWLEEDLGPELQGENLENLQTLRSRVQRMDDMLRGLLSFSRAGRAMDGAEDVDLAKLLDGIVEHEVSEQSIDRPVEGFTVRAEASCLPSTPCVLPSSE